MLTHTALSSDEENILNRFSDNEMGFLYSFVKHKTCSIVVKKENCVNMNIASDFRKKGFIILIVRGSEENIYRLTAKGSRFIKALSQ